jgi:uncharacterized protein (TIGR02217 family)
MYLNVRLPLQMELNSKRRETEEGLQINRLANGRERRNMRYAQSVLEYEIGFPPQGYEDTVILEVKNLFRVSRGGNIPFRFRDFDPTMSALSLEPIGVGDAIETEFQVKKTWTLDGQTATRIITKPAPTLSVYKNGGLQTLTTHYTIDYGTGLITFVTPPGVGQVVAVTGFFDILVRFNKEYEAAGITHLLEGAEPFTLTEVNDYDA